MKFSPNLCAKLGTVRAELLAAEKAHPGSRNLKVLHARMTEALQQAHEDGHVSQDDVQTLGGGTDKS
jgi:hypothetical protein